MIQVTINYIEPKFRKYKGGKEEKSQVGCLNVRNCILRGENSLALWLFVLVSQATKYNES